MVMAIFLLIIATCELQCDSDVIELRGAYVCVLLLLNIEFLEIWKKFEIRIISGFVKQVVDFLL